MGTAAEYNVIRPKILSAKPLPYLHKLNSLTLVLEDDYTLLQHALRLISQRWRYHLQEMRVIIMLTPRLPMDAKAIQTAQFLDPALHVQPSRSLCNKIIGYFEDDKVRVHVVHLVHLEIRQG